MVEILWEKRDNSVLLASEWQKILFARYIGYC